MKKVIFEHLDIHEFQFILENGVCTYNVFDFIHFLLESGVFVLKAMF